MYPLKIAAAPDVSITKMPLPAVPLLNQSSLPASVARLKKFARTSASKPKFARITGEVICAFRNNGKRRIICNAYFFNGIGFGYV